MAEKAEKATPKDAAKAERAEIGFGGGQVIAVRLASKELTDLRKAVEKGEGWHKLETEDGPISLDLAKVVFIRAASPEHRVGFSGT
jgi:hypothetical protein